MKNKILAFLAVGLLAGPMAAQAVVVFDNGPYDGSQIGRFNNDPWTMFEDFALTSPTTITGFQWSQHDNSSDYISTTLSIFNALPSAGSLLFSADFVAARVANGLPVIFGNYLGFDYEISGLSIALAPGTYYFGISNNIGGGGWTWDQTTGSSQTIAGRWQGQDPLAPGTFYAEEDSVFRINSDVTSVPEPGTLALLGLGLLGLGFSRRRKLN